MSRFIDVDLIREFLKYDPIMGTIKWAKAPNDHSGVRVWDEATYRHPRGYVCVKLQGRVYKAEEIAWILFNGSQPPLIMFVDGNTSNICIANLRRR